MKKNKTAIILTICLPIFLVVFALGLILGRYGISFEGFFKAIFTNDHAFDMERSIIINLRLPRTIIACLTGMALSVSGLLYQETFRNKLVSPDLLGVSSGASVGAGLAIILGLSSAAISLFSFVFGIVAVAFTMLVFKAFNNKSSAMLVMAGIIVGGLMSSILSFIKYFASDEVVLFSITYWLMGSFENSTMENVWIMLPIVAVCCTFLLVVSWRINLVALGREEALTKGINYNFYRTAIIIIATLLTAVTVSFCGTISWVGLVVPHIARLLVGRNTRKSIPVCMAFGGIFMILVDILSRTFTSAEIPISAVTGLFGTVIFVAILIQRRRRVQIDD